VSLYITVPSLYKSSGVAVTTIAAELAGIVLNIMLAPLIVKAVVITPLIVTDITLLAN